MNIVAVFLLVLVPTIVAILTKWWFWLIPSHSQLKRKSKTIDTSYVCFPGSPTTLKDFRDFQNQGSKTVLVHHIKKLAEETERKIRNDILYTVATNAIFVFIIILAIINNDPDKNKYINKGFIDSLLIVLQRMPYFYALPLGMVILILRLIYSYKFFKEQLNKYNDILSE